MREAFVSALGTGLTISATTTLIGAGVAWMLIKRGATQAQAPPSTGPPPPAALSDADTDAQAAGAEMQVIA